MAKQKYDRNKYQATSVALLLLEMYEYSVQSEIAAYKDYIGDTQKTLKKRQADFNLMIKELMDKHPNDHQEIGEAYETQYSNHNEFFPAVFHNSTLLAVYAYFEYTLKKICETVDRYGKYDLGIDDLNGTNYIDRGRKYLQKVIGIDLEDMNAVWEQIVAYQFIRNRIVHNSSNIIVNKKEKNIARQPYYGFITNNASLKLEEKGVFVIISHKFNLEFCDKIKEYLIVIIKRLTESLNSWKR